MLKDEPRIKDNKLHDKEKKYTVTTKTSNDYKQPQTTRNHQRTTTNHQRTTTSHQQTTTNHQQMTTNYQQTTINYQQNDHKRPPLHMKPKTLIFYFFFTNPVITRITPILKNIDNKGAEAVSYFLNTCAEQAK